MIRPGIEHHGQDSNPTQGAGPQHKLIWHLFRSMTACTLDVRFTPKSGHSAAVSERPLCANSGHQRAAAMHLVLSSMASSLHSPDAVQHEPYARRRRAMAK